MYIHVFKTNIVSSIDRINIARFLNENQDISAWNIDKWDAENILRIESSLSDHSHIIRCVQEAGYNCEALED